MNRLGFSIIAFSIIGLCACEKDIYPELEEAEPVIVIDAWVNGNFGAEKVIFVSASSPYYNAEIPPPIENAEVRVLKLEDQSFHIFREIEPGKYVDSLFNDTSFWNVGSSYQLMVSRSGGINIQSEIVAMNRVPQIDSLFFEGRRESSFNPEGYYAEFLARDLPGVGDTYWIKSYRNGLFLNRPSELNYAFDAGISGGGSIDGVAFLPPIRDGINADDVDEDGNPVAPFLLGDSLRVEIHSISNDAHQFLVELQTQIDRPGGFGELFAVPLANLPTNLENMDKQGRKAVGFFNVAAVSMESAYLDPNNPPPFE